MGIAIGDGTGISIMIENWPREDVEYAIRWWGRVLADMRMIGFEGRRMGMRERIESYIGEAERVLHMRGYGLGGDSWMARQPNLGDAGADPP